MLPGSDPIVNLARQSKTTEQCRKHAINDATFYTRQAKYGGGTGSDAARLLALKDEHRG